MRKQPWRYRRRESFLNFRTKYYSRVFFLKRKRKEKECIKWRGELYSSSTKATFSSLEVIKQEFAWKGLSICFDQAGSPTWCFPVKCHAANVLLFPSHGSCTADTNNNLALGAIAIACLRHEQVGYKFREFCRKIYKQEFELYRAIGLLTWIVPCKFHVPLQLILSPKCRSAPHSITVRKTLDSLVQITSPWASREEERERKRVAQLRFEWVSSLLSRAILLYRTPDKVRSSSLFLANFDKFHGFFSLSK